MSNGPDMHVLSIILGILIPFVVLVGVVMCCRQKRVDRAEKEDEEARVRHILQLVDAKLTERLPPHTIGSGIGGEKPNTQAETILVAHEMSNKFDTLPSPTLPDYSSYQSPISSSHLRAKLCSGVTAEAEETSDKRAELSSRPILEASSRASRPNLHSRRALEASETTVRSRYSAADTLVDSPITKPELSHQSTVIRRAIDPVDVTETELALEADVATHELALVHASMRRLRFLASSTQEKLGGELPTEGGEYEKLGQREKAIRERLDAIEHQRSIVDTYSTEVADRKELQG